MEDRFFCSNTHEPFITTIAKHNIGVVDYESKYNNAQKEYDELSKKHKELLNKFQALEHAYNNTLEAHLNVLPERHIINENATVLFFKGGNKIIVKRCKDDNFNARLGFLTAFFQRYCGMSKNKANKYLAKIEDDYIAEENKAKEESNGRTKIQKSKSR